MSKQEEIIEVCGKKVVVRYARTQEDACASCAFCSRKECHDLDCNMRDIIGESVSKYAYFVEAEQPEEKDYKKLYEELVNSEWYKKYYQGTSVGDSVAVEQPEADVNKHAVKHAFLHCDKAGKIVSEMYGDKINNPRNIDKYLAFLKQVELDDRFGELAGILQRYGAMTAPKEQPETDFDELIKQEMVKVYETYTRPDYIEENTTEAAYDFDMHIARHFAEWERKRTLDKVVEWMKANLTYTHPRKGDEACMVNIPAFRDAMNEDNT
jgi:hypothetical protein